MSNIYDYLKEDCYESFDERELTSVDSLALSFASYYQYNKRSLEGLNSYIKEDVKLKDILFSIERIKTTSLNPNMKKLYSSW